MLIKTKPGFRADFEKEAAYDAGKQKTKEKSQAGKTKRYQLPLFYVAILLLCIGCIMVLIQHLCQSDIGRGRFHEPLYSACGGVGSMRGYDVFIYPV